MYTERVHVVSNGRRLSAWLDLPETAEPHPAIILVHGSGPTNLEQEPRYRAIREAFTCAGLACLMWDKPGCGRSDGKQQQIQSHRERACEVVAAVESLSRRRDVDPARIGLWGISEGAWISALVASECSDVAWAILVSGPSATLARAAEYIAHTNLKIEGHSQAEIEAHLKTIRRCFQLLEARAPFEAFLAASEAMRANSFFQLTGWSKLSRADWEDPTLRENLQTDTRALLKGVRCPVLAVFGEKDSQVDWRKSMAVHQRVLQAAGHTDATVKAFAGANHNLRKCGTGSVRETRSGGQGAYVPGYIEAMVGWLKRRGYAVRNVPRERRGDKATPAQHPP